MAELKVEGVRELDEWFKTATPKLERQALRPGVRRGARVIVTEAKRRVPVLTGGLKRSLTVKMDATEARRKAGEITALATFRRPQGNHAHLVERGHDIKTTTDGPKLGSVAPRPFMRPAREEKKHAVRGEVEKKVREWIKKQKAKARA